MSLRGGGRRRVIGGTNGPETLDDVELNVVLGDLLENTQVRFGLAKSPRYCCVPI